MKKLIALLGVITLICSMAFPALANGSIGPLQPTYIGGNTFADPGPMKDHLRFQSDASSNAKWLPAVKEAFDEFNNGQSQFSPRALIERLMQLEVNNDKVINGDSLELKNESGENTELLNLGTADFGSSFSENNLNYDGTVFYTFNGNVVPVQETMVYEQLKGRTAGEFCILLINPETGYFTIIDLNPDAFNAETGEITVDFPFLGLYVLIEK